MSGVCNRDILESMYKTMLVIRKVEQTLLDLFSEGVLSGTTHTSIGQEAIAVASMSHVHEGDVVFSNHRCHGHYIAYGGPVDGLIAEIMGKQTGVCGGRGGSQHLCYKGFRSNGIQGGILPNATGAGFAEKLKSSNNIAVVFMGDGTLGEGIVYETLNLASLWSIPVLFILENNHYAQSTPSRLGVSGDIVSRANAFGIASDRVETNDAAHLYEVFKKRFDHVRSQQRPFFQVVDTYRLAPHSKGDDFRDRDEIEFWRRSDPVAILGTHFKESEIREYQLHAEQIVKRAVNAAREAPFPTIEVCEYSWSSEKTSVSRPDHPLLSLQDRQRGHENLNKALNYILGTNENTVVLGEDIIDPYGGAFKVTKGLSTKYPERVITTPISEAGITGLAVGMAMQGMRPIVEIMFGDFVSLTFDQLLNHATKYSWMYNGQVSVPLVVRTPMGGGRGYGPTHSQSLEKHFLGIPGLTVVAPSNFHNPGAILVASTLGHDGPVLFIENKILYTEMIKPIMDNRMEEFFVQQSDSQFPTVKFSLVKDVEPDAVLLTYGGSVSLALEAAKRLLIQDEVIVDIVAPSLLSPLPIDDILQMVGQCRALATLEEGTLTMSWGAEVAAQLCSSLGALKYRRIAAHNNPIPSSKQLELNMLPSIETVVDDLRRLTS